jgi:hypothetical protein
LNLRQDLGGIAMANFFFGEVVAIVIKQTLLGLIRDYPKK